MNNFFLPRAVGTDVYIKRILGLKSVGDQDSGQNIVELFWNTRGLGAAVRWEMAYLQYFSIVGL
jgi:hypothetical protein